MTPQNITVLNGKYQETICLMPDGDHLACLVWQEKFAGNWHDLKSIEDRLPVGMWRQVWKPYDLKPIEI